ncbi:unnamed protein product [Heterobilharzia americana]|nr:unnamed protein product [Heterobilharzia americana]
MNRNKMDDLTSRSNKMWKNVFEKFNLSFRKSKRFKNTYSDDKLDENAKFTKWFTRSLRGHQHKARGLSVPSKAALYEKGEQSDEIHRKSCPEEYLVNNRTWFRGMSQARLYSSMHNRKTKPEFVRNSQLLFGPHETSPNVKITKGMNDAATSVPQVSSSAYVTDVATSSDSPYRDIPETTEVIDQSSLFTNDKEQQTVTPTTPIIKCTDYNEDEHSKLLPPPPPPPPILPPFFTSSNYLAINDLESPMPYNMKPKKIFSAPFRLKKACVSPLSKIRLKENSVWVQIDESNLLSEEFVRRLHRRFQIKGNKPMITGESNKDCRNTAGTQNTKSNRDSLMSDQLSSSSYTPRSIGLRCQCLNSRAQMLNILPFKAAQAIAIAMVSAHFDPENVAEAIIELKTSVLVNRRKSLLSKLTLDSLENDSDSPEDSTTYRLLPENLLITLIKFMPEMDVILKLSNSQIDISVLTETDKLLYLISQLRHRLPAHLHALRMLLRFDIFAEQIKKALQAAHICLSEIQHSQSLRQILSCALALINALNASRLCSSEECNQPNLKTSQSFLSRKPLVGFEVRNLVRLADTHDATNQRNLIHYLVELMELNFTKKADIWADEIPTLDRAHSLYCAKSIVEMVVEMKRDIARLQIDMHGVVEVTNSISSGCILQSSSDPTDDALKANLSFGTVMGKFLPHAIAEVNLKNSFFVENLLLEI